MSGEEPTALGLVAGLIDGLVKKMDVLQSGMAELKSEVVAVGSTAERTLNQATRTNGRVDKAERDIEELQRRILHEDAVNEGRAEIRAANRTRFMAIWDRAEKPVITGAMMLVFGVGLRIGAFLLGGPW